MGCGNSKETPTPKPKQACTTSDASGSIVDSTGNPIIDITSSSGLTFNAGKTACTFTINECSLLNAKYVYGNFMPASMPFGLSGYTINGKWYSAGIINLPVNVPITLGLLPNTVTFTSISNAATTMAKNVGNPALANKLTDFLISPTDTNLDSVIATFNAAQLAQQGGTALTSDQQNAILKINNASTKKYSINVLQQVSGFQNESQGKDLDGYDEGSKLLGGVYHPF